MIITVLYFLCFAVLLFNVDKNMRYVALFGMTHIIFENGLYYWFLSNPIFFDLSLYLTGCWFLDIMLIFSSACVLEGWAKKFTLALTIPILFVQMTAMQYPLILPWLLPFAISDAYPSMMEVVILCATLKDTTIREWLKTVTILSLLILARFIHLIVR